MSEKAQFQPIIRTLDLKNDSQALIRLGVISLGAKWNEDFLHWKYLSNPAGTVYGYCAELQEHPVGFYLTIPVILKLAGRVIQAGQAVDAMVDPNARRFGLFTTLGNLNFEQMDREGVQLVYAYPNPVSEAGSIKKFSFVKVGDVPRFIKMFDVPGDGQKRSLNNYASLALYRALCLGQRKQDQYPPGVSVKVLGSFDDRASRLWKKSSARFPIAVHRDAAYLNWRYVLNPCRRFILLAAERGPDLAGYAVLSFRDLQVNNSATLVELLVAPGDEPAGLALLAEASRQARSAGCCQLHAWMLPHHEFYVKLLKKSSFVHWANRFALPSFRTTTPFIVRLRPDAQLEPDPAVLENWYLNAGDHDYY
jgi:hypothetical protein